MKKKIQALIGGLALAAIVGVNGYMAIGNGISTSELNVADVENVAEGEGRWYSWVTSYNTTGKNDTKEKIKCPVTVTIQEKQVLANGGVSGGNGYVNLSFNVQPTNEGIASYTISGEIEIEVKKCGCSIGNCQRDEDCLDHTQDIYNILHEKCVKK